MNGTPDASLAEIADVPGLPRVLLVGDSISIGYTLPVRARLRGRANVHRPPENCGDTGRGLRRLEVWLGPGRWDVIHFNFGLHDLKYLDARGHYVAPALGRQVTSVPAYADNLRELVTQLQATGARLIFATTTPVPAGTLARVAHGEISYNAAAVEVMKELGVAINDLHAFVVPRQKTLQRPQDVHFTHNGSEELADAVARAVMQG